MIPNSEAIHSSPKPPTRPFTHTRLDQERHDESNKIQHLSRDNRPTPEPHLVEHIRKAEHDPKGQECTHRSQSISCDPVEPESHDNRRRVGGQRAPCGKHNECGHEMRPATVLSHGAPDDPKRDLEAMRASSIPAIVVLESSLQDVFFGL